MTVTAQPLLQRLEQHTPTHPPTYTHACASPWNQVWGLPSLGFWVREGVGWSVFLGVRLSNGILVNIILAMLYMSSGFLCVCLMQTDTAGNCPAGPPLEVLSTRSLHCTVTFPFVINKYLMGRYFETTSIVCF